MFGTLLNVGGFVLGGLAGLARRHPLSVATESWFKVSLGALTVFFGLRLTWVSFTGSFGQLLKQLVILLLALMLGKMTGQLMRLQKISNSLGQRAREAIASAKPGAERQDGAGFKSCAALFCASPLGILGALQDGLSFSTYFYPLAIKGVIDGLATFGLIKVFGSSVLLSALPVFVFQGASSLRAARVLEPLLSPAGLLNSVNAVSGLLIFCVALVMLGLKRLALANYLPSLVFAPLLTWLWR